MWELSKKITVECEMIQKKITVQRRFLYQVITKVTQRDSDPDNPFFQNILDSKGYGLLAVSVSE